MFLPKSFFFFFIFFFSVCAVFFIIYYIYINIYIKKKKVTFTPFPLGVGTHLNSYLPVYTKKTCDWFSQIKTSNGRETVLVKIICDWLFFFTGGLELGRRPAQVSIIIITCCCFGAKPNALSKVFVLCICILFKNIKLIP